MMDIKFAYSSNGDGFEEYDFLTGQERQISMDEFPTPEELLARYNAEVNGGQGLSSNQIKVMSQPYYTSQNTYSPRYYQRNAVNKTLDAIAKGQDRILLVAYQKKSYDYYLLLQRLRQDNLCSYIKHSRLF